MLCGIGFGRRCSTISNEGGVNITNKGYVRSQAYGLITAVFLAGAVFSYIFVGQSSLIVGFLFIFGVVTAFVLTIFVTRALINKSNDYDSISTDEVGIHVVKDKSNITYEWGDIREIKTEEHYEQGGRIPKIMVRILRKESPTFRETGDYTDVLPDMGAFPQQLCGMLNEELRQRRAASS
jgi:hypothetical protein